MDFPTAFRAVLRNWWLIALAMGVALQSSVYYLSRQEPVYQAVATVELAPSDSFEEPSDLIYALDMLSADRTTINTLARVATGPALQGDVIAQLNLPPATAEEMVLSAVVLPETNLIEIRTEHADPAVAAAISNTVAEELAAAAPEPALELRFVGMAIPPETPIAPQPIRTIALSLVFGFGLGTVAALLGHSIRWTPAARRRARTERVDGVGRWPSEGRRPIVISGGGAQAGLVEVAPRGLPAPALPRTWSTESPEVVHVPDEHLWRTPRLEVSPKRPVARLWRRWA